MQGRYRRVPLRARRRRKRSYFGEQYALPVVVICIAFLALFICVAVLSRSCAKDDMEVSGFLFDGDVTVCIDPGHGYDDPGALSDYTGDLYEKDINLAVSLSLAEKLSELGYEVVMTRDSDSPGPDMEPDGRGLYTLDPNERTAWVNNSDADLFISLHCNVAQNSPSTVGTQIYYCSDTSPESADFAGLLCETLRSDMPTQRCDPKDTNSSSSFAVIRDITVPCLLVEMGFISSPDEAAKLCDPAWQDGFASALANGISRYIAENSR